MKSLPFIAALFLSTVPAWANEVSILQADFAQRNGAWDIAVTLKHADSGWDHYADAWRVVDEHGKVFGTRTLVHPHEDEQPFTRDLSGVAIPVNQQVVYVEAHDKVHGWSPKRLKVDLRLPQGPGFHVAR